MQTCEPLFTWKYGDYDLEKAIPEDGYVNIYNDGNRYHSGGCYPEPVGREMTLPIAYRIKVTMKKAA